MRLTFATRIESKPRSSPPEIRSNLHKKAQRKNQAQDNNSTEEGFLNPSQEDSHPLLVQTAWSERQDNGRDPYHRPNQISRDSQTARLDLKTNDSSNQRVGFNVHFMGFIR